MDKGGAQALTDALRSLRGVLDEPLHAPLPNSDTLRKASLLLHKQLPIQGYDLRKTCEHLLQDIVPGLNGSSLSPTYYGFVTGGITPVARVADHIVTTFDQNVSVHLPKETLSTVVEDRALYMLQQLLDLDPHEWHARCFTTGATASNILGLACGREYVIIKALTRAGQEPKLGEGLLSSCRRAKVESFQVLTTMPHSSLGKAANIVGIGGDNVTNVSREGTCLEFDMVQLEQHLAMPKSASIVVISCGEVNTGGFATSSAEKVEQIRRLCDQYGAWLHVDGAFGIFARALPKNNTRYNTVRRGAAGLEHADSITGDGHKLLNVPYDCGFFFSKHPDISQRVCQNTNAAYLSTSGAADGIPSPLNMRLENSARFRGLTVYATLAAYGREGYAAMIARMVNLARMIASHVRDECDGLELLPQGCYGDQLEEMFMCVLFRARNDALNEVLTEKINATRKVYASSTRWEGRPATRFAIGKWDVDVERDFTTLSKALEEVVEAFTS